MHITADTAAHDAAIIFFSFFFDLITNFVTSLRFTLDNQTHHV